MKIHTQRLAALAALVLVAGLGLTACGDDDDGGDGGAGADGGGDAVHHVPAQEPREPLLRRQHHRRRAGRRRVRRQDRGGRARRRHPRLAGVVHQHRRPAGRRRARRLGQRPDRDLRRARGGTGRRRQGGHLRLRHRPRVPRRVRQPGRRRGHRQGPGGHDRGADRRLRRDRDPLRRGERHQPERLDRADGGRARGQPPDIELVDTVYGDDDDQKSFDQTAALLQSTPTSRASSRRPRSASRRPPATCPTRSTRARWR